MSRYETYKSSEVVWIGDIPQQWKIKRLKDLVNPKITDGPHETPELVDDEDGIPFISAEAITENGINYEARGGNISVEQDRIYSLKCKPKRDDIFIVKSGSTTGRIGYVDTDLNFNIWSPLALVRSNNKTSSRFLYHFLSSDCIQRQIQNSWSFGTQPNIGMGVIERLRLAIPEYDEQLTIANYLDEQTQKIDRLIANKKAQAEKLKELRQIEINNAVTKGLNPNAEMKDSGIEWLGKIPKHWELKKIKQLLKPEKNAIKTGPFGSDLKFEDLIEEGIKVYNQRSVLDNDWKSGEGYISAEKYESLKTCTIFPDDIVITTRGTIGKVSIFPADAELGILHPCLMRIQMNSQRILNDYLKIIINDSSFFFEALKLASNATTIDVIYSDSLKEVKIPVPPTNEQVEITTYLQKKVSAIDQLIKNIEAQIEKLQELRKIKIYEAVTGKIKVNAYAETTA